MERKGITVRATVDSAVSWRFRGSLYNLKSKRKLKGKGSANIIELEILSENLISERCKL